jgi:hypothetical protein
MSDNRHKLKSIYDGVLTNLEMMVKNPSHFFINQLVSAEEIIQAYFEDCRYVILTAEMQSGKTDTFYLVAFLMLLHKVVKTVYIICGSADTELRNQHRLDDPDIEKVYNKLHLYLANLDERRSDSEVMKSECGVQRSNLGWSTEEILTKIGEIKRCIHPVFGTQLKKVEYEARDVLFIHDESHFAQSEGNMVDLSLRSTGIRLDGDVGQLVDRNYYYLSVSATPCSELSNNMLLRQGKRVVAMMPGEGYMSIERIYLTGRIHGFETPEEGLIEAITTGGQHMSSSMRDLTTSKAKFDAWANQGTPGYGLVRAQHKFMGRAQEIVCARGWDFIVYDGNRRPGSPTINQILSQPPQRPTIIFIKALLRMGKRLYKKYVKFCLESAKGSNTDTLMQSLLGRCCGYDSLDTIQFYVDQEFLDSGELERYIAMANGQPVIPFKAMNLVKGTGRETQAKPSKDGGYLTVPLTLPVFFANDKNDDTLKDKIIQEIHTNYEAIQSVNSPEQNAAIQDLLLNQLLDKKQFSLHRLNETTCNASYKGACKNIPLAIREKKARNLGQACGLKAKKAVLWYVETDGFEGLTRGHVYISCKIDIGPPKRMVVPSTTGNEIFR